MHLGEASERGAPEAIGDPGMDRSTAASLHSVWQLFSRCNPSSRISNCARVFFSACEQRVTDSTNKIRQAGLKNLGIPCLMLVSEA